MRILSFFAAIVAMTMSISVEAKVSSEIAEKQDKVHNSGEDTHFKYTHSFYREKEFTDEKGKKDFKRQYVSRILPGEALLAVVNYIYKLDDVAKEPIITLPLPKEVVFIEKTASNPEYLWVSADDGKSWSKFENLKIPEVGGKKRAATGKDITHLQWRIASTLNKGESGTLEYKVMVP